MSRVPSSPDQLVSESAHDHTHSACTHDHADPHAAHDHTHSHTEISPAEEEPAKDAAEGQSGIVSPEQFSKDAELAVNIEELLDAKMRGEDTTAIETSNNINLKSIPLQSSTKRRPHLHKGKKVYEWEQSFEEVNVFLTIPPNIKSADLDVKIEMRRVTLGVKGRRPYLNSTLPHPVRSVPESTWALEDRVLQLTLVKAQPGLVWERAFEGHDRMSVAEEQAVEGDLSLEKCRQDYPDFFINHDTDMPNSMDIDKLLTEHGATPADVDMARRYIAQTHAE